MKKILLFGLIGMLSPICFAAGSAPVASVAHNGNVQNGNSDLVTHALTDAGVPQAWDQIKTNFSTAMTRATDTHEGFFGSLGDMFTAFFLNIFVTPIKKVLDCFLAFSTAMATIDWTKPAISKLAEDPKPVAAPVASSADLVAKPGLVFA